MSDSLADRLTQLEAAVRRAAEVVARLREENDRLRRDNRRLEDERRQVLGQTLTVRSEADPAYLRSLAAFVEKRVTALQQGGVRDPMKALVLAALEIADDLHRAREEKTRDAGEVEARLGALVELLDRVAPDPPRRT